MKNELEFVQTKLVKDHFINPPVITNSPDDVILYLGKLFEDADQEMTALINMTQRSRVINVSIMTKGTINVCLVDVPKLFRTALLSGSSGFILLHNHPSGDPEPSNEDIELTRRIYAAAQIVGVELVDHIILGEKDSYFSFRADYPDMFRNNGISSWAAEPDNTYLKGREPNVYKPLRM